MVTGGWDGRKALKTTEISWDQGENWSEVKSAELKFARYGLRASTLNNRMFIFGLEIIEKIVMELNYDIQVGWRETRATT